MTSDHSEHPGREERSSARGNRGLEWRSEGTRAPGSHWAVCSLAPGWGWGSGLHGGPSDCFNSFGPQRPTLCFSRYPPLHSLLFLGWHGVPVGICNSGDSSLPGLTTGRRPALHSGLPRSTRHPCAHTGPDAPTQLKRPAAQLPRLWPQPLESLPKSPLLGSTPWPPQRDPQQQMFICGLPGARHRAKCLLTVDSFYPHRDPTEQRSKQRFPNNPPKSHSACVDEAQAPD